MKESNEILNELASISQTLATINKVNIFRVPEGYFDDLSAQILTSAFLGQCSAKQAGSAPKGYFDSLSNKIIVRIKNADANTVEETKNISPALYSLKDKQVFNVPEGYFSTLGEHVINKVNRKSAKVISFHTRKRWRQGYVAAAMVTILVSVGALQLFNSKNAPDKGDIAVLAENFSKNMPAYMKDAIQYQTDEQLNRGIASLSNDEIAAYLEHHGSIMDDYLLAKDIDTESLPDATEYLIDENTLSDFLNQIGVQPSTENNE